MVVGASTTTRHSRGAPTLYFLQRVSRHTTKMPDDGGFFASHFFNSTKGGGASGNGFVSLQSCTDSWLGCLCVLELHLKKMEF